jgi:V8-like Glu-specific endopeptidase
MARKRGGGRGRKPAARPQGAAGPARAGRPLRVDPLGGELFPPRLEEIAGLARAAVERPEESETYARILESICGTTDDSQPVEQYDGTLGVTVAFVNGHQAPVGQVQWNANLGSIYTSPGNVSDVRWGTGTLITNDLFLTAGHLFDQTGGGWIRPLQNGTLNTIAPAEIATNMHVNFNYQVDPAGTLRPEQRFPVVALVEYRLGGLDFAVARLGGNPGGAFGFTQIAGADAVAGEEICIIGHPAGVPKRIEAGTVLQIAGDYLQYDDIDTLGGNSGSGVVRETDGLVVGVHTNGGCNAAGTGSNSGVRIAAITAQSPTLQGLGPTRKVLDDLTIKFSDDATRKFTDDITRKFADDVTAKVSDDATRKFADDIGTRKVLDDGGTNKRIDDVKGPGLDTMPAFDAAGVMGGAGQPAPSGQAPGSIGARPFILATPHHSMAWASAGGAAQEAQAAQYEQALVELQQQIQRGEEELEHLHRQYQLLLAEYQALLGG